MSAAENPTLSLHLTVKPARVEKKWVRFACICALLLAMVCFGVIRMRLRTMPLERDEGEFAYVGQLMLHGIPPYKIACNMKLPGTYAAYAAMEAAFGQTASGIRTGLIFFNAATTILIFFLGKRLYGTLAGAVAGMTYTLLSCRPAVLGVYAHATHFVVFFALAGILLLLRALDKERTVLFFCSGICLGLAFLMKQPGILFAVFAVLYWLWWEWKRPFLWRNAAVRGGALLAGLALPYALTCLILWRAGVFSSFWFWTWSYALEYGTITTWTDVRSALRGFFPWVIRPPVIWELVVLGVVAPLWSRYARVHGGFVTTFCLFSVLAVCPGFYFRPHYYILMLPAAALCVGVAVDAAREGLLRKRLSTPIVWLPVLYFAISFTLSVRAEYRKSLHLDPVSLVRKMQTLEPFPEAITVGSYIKANSSEQDTVALFGSEPEICFYSARHCASNYLYTYPLMEKQKFARQMQADMMQQVRNAQPRFLVYADDVHSWGTKPVRDANSQFLDTVWEFRQSNYELVDQVPVPGDPEQVWGDHATFYIFRRIDPLPGLRAIRTETLPAPAKTR
jgi:hypothetical protein